MHPIRIRHALGAFAATLAVAASAQAATLHDNGSPSTGPVASNGAVAPGRTTWAESQGGTIGWTSSANSSGNLYTLADDFVVAPGTSWSIASIDVLAYVTDVPIRQSPILGMTLQIWSGTPGSASSSVIWGDMTTNRMTSSVFSHIFRAELGYADTQRPIWDNSVATDGLVLGAGTYWVEWSAITGSTSTRAFGVPVHVDGETAKPGSNAMQSSYIAETGVTTWAQIVDSGVGQVQDLPFVINGTAVAAVPEPASAALWLLGGGALVATRRRRRGNQAAVETA